MIIPIADSCGFPEPDSTPSLLMERWSDEARAGALAARHGRRGGSPKDKATKRKGNADDERAYQKYKAEHKTTEKPSFGKYKAGEKPSSAGAVAARVRGDTAARQGGVAARATSAIAGDDAKRARAAAVAKAEAKDKEQGKGGGKEDEKPKRAGEETNAKGERVIKYSDGSTVTTHKDGTATARKADGTERRGTYKDPAPKDDPEGFKSRTAADDERDAKKVVSDRKRGEREQATATRQKASAEKKAAAEKRVAYRRAPAPKRRVTVMRQRR